MTGIIIGSFIAGFFTILGTFIGQHLSKKNNLEAIKIHEFVKAGVKFKEAFVEALDRIHNSSLHTLDIRFLKAQISAQEMALKTFLVHVPDSKREGLRYSWKEYKRKDDNEFAYEYTAIEGSEEAIIKEKRQLLLDRINYLFHFTDPKIVFDE